MPATSPSEPSRTQGLLARWQTLAADLGLAPAHHEVAHRLLVAYVAVDRYYHTDVHLAAVLAVLDDVWRGPGPVAPAARAAAWFHDAVYDPQRSDNEAASARLARSELGPVGVAAEVLRDIEQLVLATATHEAVPVAGAAELLDADLAILGAPADVYDRYAAAIRREYAHLDDEAFGRGRAAVLEGLLKRPTLFLTTAGKRRFETAARENLQRELTGLANAPG